MDIKPTDEFDTEERPEEDADDDFVGTLPDVSEENWKSFDDPSIREIDLSVENTFAEVDEFYKSFPEYKFDITIKLRNKTKFSIDPYSKQLRIRDNGRYVYLSSEKNPYNFLKLSTIASKYGKGGAIFIRDVLGFKDYTSKGATQKIIETAKPEINMNKLTPTSEQVDNTPPEKMGDIVDKVDNSVQAVLDKVAKTDIGVNTDDLILQQKIRDLKRANKFLLH